MKIIRTFLVYLYKKCSYKFLLVVDNIVFILIILYCNHIKFEPRTLDTFFKSNIVFFSFLPIYTRLSPKYILFNVYAKCTLNTIQGTYHNNKHKKLSKECK